ncbi:D-isomer specific 2-hydroxyacid dehydrogenase family protein [Oceanicola granulosus HTCC2516]|uniref:D-isomer specific 2-hydroxyacid dehydrogenase family protein n=1 Tax=Oceanicola granulosus (strain ATCC BAA-861 / DSM 15982 / KCTC 12143 / HTCC2516) TaxID=314256 RepID=Q2CH01_OCEGH|nr:glyoxylate/hydroxypyruvate reductase A [Oceanicola granulosus]EAR52010.1 D-isomer specific 2-hydroxyacid dehydrogenase family protein [Oceanicola granulosus HTCC2516]
MAGVLFLAGHRWPDYREVLPRAVAEAGVRAEVSPDLPAEAVDYIVYGPARGAADFSRYPRLKAVFSLWAGVESIVANPTLRVPLTRMVDPGLEAGMVEYVAGHVLRHHLGMDAHIHNPDHAWAPRMPPLASERTVAVLGLGALGAAAARTLAGLGFAVRGWSRTAREVPGVTCHHGADGLAAALAGAEMLVLLLPLTEATERIVDAAALARLAPGAVLLNPGRGALVDDAALLEALDSGRLGHATLDTFRTEPLPRDHPFWRHERVTVTPHIASETRPATAARVIAENLRRAEAGEPLLHLVDRGRGY